MANPYLPNTAPSMQMERGWNQQVNVGQADYPEGPLVVAGRHALFAPIQYMVQQSWEYGAAAVEVVTWDYASPFLYARSAYTPYPYVLVE